MLRESVALGVLTLTRSEVRLPAGHHTGAAGGGGAYARLDGTF
jgi:hypothetical protein